MTFAGSACRGATLPGMASHNILQAPQLAWENNGFSVDVVLL